MDMIHVSNQFSTSGESSIAILALKVPLANVFLLNVICQLGLHFESHPAMIALAILPLDTQMMDSNVVDKSAPGLVDSLTMALMSFLGRFVCHFFADI